MSKEVEYRTEIQMYEKWLTSNKGTETKEKYYRIKQKVKDKYKNATNELWKICT